MLQLMKFGRSPTMRDLPRTSRMSVAWLSEMCPHESCSFRCAKSDRMAVDISTTPLPSFPKWSSARRLIGVSLKAVEFNGSATSGDADLVHCDHVAW